MKGFSYAYTEENSNQFLIGPDGDQSVVTNVVILEKKMVNKKMKGIGEAVVFIRCIKEASKNEHQFQSSKIKY